MNRLASQLKLWSVLSLALLSIGCASAGTRLSEIAPEVNATFQPEPSLILAPGDTVSVQFRTAPEFDHTAIIERDGSASFRRVGRTECAGKSLEALQEELTSAYSKVFDTPGITVSLSVPAAREALLMGEVTRQGAVPIPPHGLTLLEALGYAGGPRRDTASVKNILLVRWLPELNERKVWCIDVRPKTWGGNEQIFISPRDVILVPPKPIVVVNTWVDQYIRRMIPIPLTGAASPL